MDGQTTPFGGKVPLVEDSMYMKVRFNLFCFPWFVVYGADFSSTM